MSWIANNPVVKSRAYSNQHIAMLHGHIGFVGAVHAGHAYVVIFIGRIRPQAHERIGNGSASQLNQLTQLS